MKLGILQISGVDYDDDSIYDAPIVLNKHQYQSVLDSSYRDIGDSIVEWDKHGQMILMGWDGFHGKDSVFDSFANYPTNLKDWRALRAEIKSRVLIISGNDLSTWNTLSVSEKDIAVKYCYSFIAKTDSTKLADGVPNPYTLAQYRAEFDVNNILSREKRHQSVRGAILGGTSDIADALDALEYLQNTGLLPSYIGGKEGTISGDNEGYFDWLLSTGTYAPLVINSINIGTKTITVSGDNISKLVGVKNFTIRESTGNDLKYTLVSATLNGGNTDIVVSEVIADATADGKVYFNGFLSWNFSTVSLRDSVVSTYKDGLY